MSDQRAQQSTGYNEYYGFVEAPFSLTPDPRFAFASVSHERALQTILHALGRHEGLIVVTGDIGCGKTTLCRRLLPLLPPRTFLSLVLNPFLAADDLLKQVLEDFGLVSSDDLRRGPLVRTTSYELARTLEDFLNSLSQIDGTAVIIVDEAQNLPLRTLEQIRLLSNFETDTSKLLQIILVGQRNFEPILELEEMRQLNQRVSRRCRIEPLSSREVDAYVNHRLASAMPHDDSPQVRITPSALGAVWRLSRGVPRVINLLCDRALDLGHSNLAAAIDRRLVLAAARDLELPLPVLTQFVPVVPTLSPELLRGAAAALLIAVAAAAAFATRGAWPALPDALRPWARSAAPVAALDTQQAPSPAPAERVELASAAPPTNIVEAAPFYELTVASFETAARAKTVAGNLVEIGHPARAAASGRWQLVIVGPYTSLAEANQAKDALTRSGFSNIKIAKSP